MPKRKREAIHSAHHHRQSLAVGTRLSTDTLVLEQGSQKQPGPTRKSARVQELLQQVSEKYPRVLFPTPTPSHSPDQYRGAKRKRSDSQVPPNEEQVAERRNLSTRKSEAKGFREACNPIKHWTEYKTWPKGFADKGVTMETASSSSEYSKKRPRTSSYSQSIKNGTAPEQYSAAYEKWIEGKGLFMDVFLGGERVSKHSKEVCSKFQNAKQKAISPVVFSKDAILEVIRSCQNRNEGKANRDITPILVPPIIAMRTHSEKHLEHVVDEVNADWNMTYILAGPQIRPNLALGLSNSAFSTAEIDRLSIYSSVDNWTNFTTYMLFPFLTCEVKCGREGLDQADRQNMHSSSVALRAILRIEHEADKFRQKAQLDQLYGRVLVFSISHDQQDARLYGHFARITGNKWEYYRYSVKKYELRNPDDVIAIHNFVRNVFRIHLPEHIKRIRDALAVFPEPSTVSLLASDLNVSAGSQSNSQGELASQGAVFRTPKYPASAMKEIESLRKENEEREEKQKEQMNKLLGQLEQQRLESKEKEERMERQNKEKEERMERQNKEREEWMERQMEQQRGESNKQMEQQRLESNKQMEKIMSLFKDS